MKKILIKSASLAAAVLLTLSSFSVSAAGECSWYIKRNGNSRPGFPAEAESVKEYGGYYIDDSCYANSEKRLYLTFDAGYENGNVEKILDTLRDEGVPAAFFLLDNIILQNTDLVKRMTAEGHLVCNHTKRHKNLSSATSEEIEKDLCALEEIYECATGEKMAKYFRFPEGKYSLEALKRVNSLGYKTIFWSFGYEDWDNNKQPSEAYAIRKILDNTHPGAVILLHPNSATNAKILKSLIKSWREMGYSFGTLDELTGK